MLSIIFITAAVVLSAQAKQPPMWEERIVGGSPVKIEDYPYQISLQNNGRHFCGGTIIGPRHVVTAAHCTNGKIPNVLTIRAGSTTHRRGGQSIYVARIWQHPRYNTRNQDNDISVLELMSEISFGNSAKPAALPAQGESVRDGTVSDVSGWGYLVQGGSVPDDLHATQVPIVNHQTCAQAYSPAEITDQMICAGYIGTGGKDACQGDSGGPLVTGGKLIGVVSWGYNCADPKYPGVYANVGFLRDWIKQVSGI